MEYSIDFDLIKRKSSIHVFIVFIFEIIFFIYSVNTEPNSIYRNIWTISFVVCIIYWFWYRFSMRYIKFTGHFTLDKNQIIFTNNNQEIELELELEKIENFNIRICGYAGKEKSTYRTNLSGHDGLRNFLLFKYNNIKYEYEFYIKDLKKLKGLIYLLSENQTNIKVTDDSSCKILYQKANS
jgi:hypothetical protein